MPQSEAFLFHWCPHCVDMEPWCELSNSHVESPVSHWFNKAIKKIAFMLVTLLGIDTQEVCQIHTNVKKDSRMNALCLIDLETGNNKCEPFFVLSFTCFELSLCNPFTETIKKRLCEIYFVHLFWSVLYLKWAECCLAVVGTQLHRKMWERKWRREIFFSFSLIYSEGLDGMDLVQNCMWLLSDGERLNLRLVRDRMRAYF